jgi:hypothetical protein
MKSREVKEAEALAESREKELLEEIRALRKELKTAQRNAEDATARLSLEDQLVELKKKIVDKQIEQDRLTERHEREKRDVEHMVGLEKKRQEFEIDQAKRETMVAVREENLQADKDRFAEQLKFHEERFTTEVGYLKELMGSVLDRLPTVTVDRQITEKSTKRGEETS